MQPPQDKTNTTKRLIRRIKTKQKELIAFRQGVKMSILQDLKIKKQSMMISPNQFKLPFIDENNEK